MHFQSPCYMHKVANSLHGYRWLNGNGILYLILKLTSLSHHKLNHATFKENSLESSPKVIANRWFSG